jgi:hypothetical protein
MTESKMANVTLHVGKPDNDQNLSASSCLGWVSSIQDAGSFIRPSASISYGKSFLEALTSKYIETLHGSESQENVLLGSSRGAIIVEGVRLDKVRGRLACLERLREVSLDNESLARSDPVGAIGRACPSKRRYYFSFLFRR